MTSKNEQFTQQEAFLALCLAIASQDDDLNEEERTPLITGMKKAGLLDCEYDLREIFHSTMAKITNVFIDGKAFNFTEASLSEFIHKIKQALSEKQLEQLFDTAVNIAAADGILYLETELAFLKKIHHLFNLNTDFEKLISEQSDCYKLRSQWKEK